jgi:hypothetical protein
MKKVVSLFFAFFLSAFCFFTKVIHFNPSFLTTYFLDGEAESVNLPLLIFEKPLKFLDNGNEAIAFTTHDNKYVVKFFLSKQVKKKTYFKPKKRLKQLFGKEALFHFDPLILKKYEDAFNDFPEESALVCVSLKKSKRKLPSCTLEDYRGKSFLVDLNAHPFVIQKKAKVLKSYESLKEEDDFDQKLLGLFDLITKKGFRIDSKGFNSANYGFLEGRPVIIDLGKIEKNLENSESNLNEVLIQNYKNWLKLKD